jgi:HAD superfamily hydrolase (TIGR01490 family)
MTEAKEKGGRVAAFFDLDGTLMRLPSLEERFFCELRFRRAIPWGNYFFYLREALRLGSSGITRMVQANKMYLRGVGVERVQDFGSRHDAAFFGEAVERVSWHVREGHRIVIVSGTLEPLAKKMAVVLERVLAERGLRTNICARATRLEEVDGKWTGRALGLAMFGKEKARWVKKFAMENEWDLAECYAYGDSENDRWLLAAVGRPMAVNASAGLSHIARVNGWAMVNWKKKESSTLRHRGHGEEKAMRIAVRIARNLGVGNE